MGAGEGSNHGPALTGGQAWARRRSRGWPGRRCPVARGADGRYRFVIKKKCSFLKKRTKRLLLMGVVGERAFCLQFRPANETKVFCFFSSEKKTLPF
jgi:hypothetical protein